MQNIRIPFTYLDIRAVRYVQVASEPNACANIYST